MPRTLTRREAQRMARQRKVARGGRPRKPTPCPRCQVLCPSRRHAQVHCS